MKLKLVLLSIISILALTNTAYAEYKSIEGGIKKEDLHIIEGGINKKLYKGVDIQVLNVSFYYYSDAEMNYSVLKKDAQRQYPHLLNYREIDGIYLKALSKSQMLDKLTVWRADGGPCPYYFDVGAHIRNNGNASLTDVRLDFNFIAKIGDVKVKSSSITVDYDDLKQHASWHNWFSETVTVKILPPGENKVIYIKNISLANYLQKLNGKWPVFINVKVNAVANQDAVKNNNAKQATLELLPSEFFSETLR